MTGETRARLAAINRCFYDQHAHEFDATRSPSGAELEWIIPWVPAGARVLDIGCGNGRALRLLRSRGWEGRYVGLDSSAPLLHAAKAASNAAGAEAVSFLECDMLAQDVAGALRRAGIEASFDAVLLLAFLHHIPGAQARLAVLRQAACLRAPGGKILLSTWQFMDHARMRRKIIPWSVAGIDEREVEPSDALVGWSGSGAYRYCHWIDLGELEELACCAGLQIVLTIRAGGREGTLSLCAVLADGASGGEA